MNLKRFLPIVIVLLIFSWVISIIWPILKVVLVVGLIFLIISIIYVALQASKQRKIIQRDPEKHFSQVSAEEKKVADIIDAEFREKN